MRRCLLMALLATGCRDPVDQIRREVADLAGEDPALCGGARLDAQDDLVDDSCVSAAERTGSPYEVWGDPILTDEGDPLFHGVLTFSAGGEARWYNVLDHRADSSGGGLYVERCVSVDYEPVCDQECIDDCDT